MEMWHAGGKESCIKETYEGGRPLGRAMYIWKYIMKINLQEILREGVTLTNLVEDKDQWQVLVYTVIRGRVS
jgi:hypothetical protein